MQSVLVVDDIAENLIFLEMLLRGHGFEVMSARNGAEALEAARRRRPDLIVSDILMPLMDGYTLCKACKADGGLRDVPFVFYTATYTGPKDEALGLKLGAARFVVKPQEPDALMGILREVLAAPGAAAGVQGPAQECEVAREHLEAMARKLEKKVADLEHANRELERQIAERVAAEHERDRLEEQLRATQRLEAIGSLAGGVAHDFNNLLSVILSHTALAVGALREGDEARFDLLQVQKAGERAAVLTRQLLTFSRKQVLRPVIVNLNQVVEGMEGMLRRLVGEDVDFRKALAPGLGPVLADPGQMEQVLMNLVVNARDAMPAGGRLTIETADVELDEAYAARHVSVRPGPHVLLAVTDSGSGMDAETRARIFEPFFTTKEKGKGTGLGLSTLYGIVKQSGGNVWVYSEPGHGSTFKIYLPRDSTGAPTAVGVATERTGRADGSETVLVVEDEEDLIQIGTRALTAAGYRVLSARNGEEGLRVAARHAGVIHLLATDVIMPRMGGKALAIALSRLRPGLRVLYMSGHTEESILHHGVLEPGDRLLCKPFTVVELTRRVREVLDEPPALTPAPPTV